MSAMGLKLPEYRLFVQQLAHANYKENVCLYFFIRSSLTKQPQVKQQNKIGIYKMSTYITYIKDMHEHVNTYVHI